MGFSYISLANKYRPKTLDSIVGQDILVLTLKSAIKQGRVARVFLLSGSHGTGKTTTARVMAASINCLNNIEGTPCLKCESCTGIENSSHPDVTEIDAASNTGVDDVRAIIDASLYVPSLSKFKIYIIDEVHMLSQSAFNALLKTLEGPKPHVKFFLATTELNKIPATIISRCQHFNLARPTTPIIATHLKKIADLENIDITEDALFFIAENSYGALRDAISMLEQAYLFSSGLQITEDILRDSFGFISKCDCEKITDYIINSICKDALDLFNKLYIKGYDVLTILDAVLQNLQKIMKTVILGRSTNKVNIEFLSRLAKCLINGMEEVNGLINHHSAAEILIIRMCYLSNLPSPHEAVQNTLIKKEKWKEQSFDDKVGNNASDALVDSILKEFKGSSII